MKRTVDVEVAGQRLAIRSDEGPEYIAQLAALVDAQVRELTGERRGNPTRALALVAIQLADQLLREQDLHDRLRRDLAHQLAAIEEADAAHRRDLEALADGPAPAEADS